MTIFKLAPVLFLLVTLCSCKENKKEQSSLPSSPRDTILEPTPELTPNNYASIDVSPMDMSYFPIDYPKLKMANDTIAPPIARVIYSRPHLQKRRLFNGILKYEEPWRLGANESTEIDFYKQVIIQNKKVQAGRYIIYCIPHKDTWSVILNENIDTWGLKQDTAKDRYRFEVPITTNNPLLEYYTMIFEKTATGTDLLMAWDDVVAKLPVSW